ncbi:hypothetical protein WSK_0502 [Novosphingobium sp. Rr 2-17]|nr:hypothetical protein WSK_0502 [Novosphingobium sp. Rr 2-17]
MVDDAQAGLEQALGQDERAEQHQASDRPASPITHGRPATHEHAGGPTRFGRGWIPGERDIGLPDDDLASALSFRGEGPLGCAPFAAPSAASSTALHAWDAGRKVRFLDRLSEKGDVRAAAAFVGMSRQSAYVMRRRDVVFAQGWVAAMVLARRHAEEVLATRALDGVEEPVWFRGELVGARRRFDGRLLLAHLERLDRAAEEHSRGEAALELADRFDELLAMVAGARPEDGFFQTPCNNEPEPVLPLDRGIYAERWARRAYAEVKWDWKEAVHNGEAEAGDGPELDEDDFRVEYAADWDAWHDEAVAAVDAALAGVEIKSAGGGAARPEDLAEATGRTDGGEERQEQGCEVGREVGEFSPKGVSTVSTARDQAEDYGPELGPEVDGGSGVSVRLGGDSAGNALAIAPLSHVKVDAVLPPPPPTIASADFPTLINQGVTSDRLAVVQSSEDKTASSTRPLPARRMPTCWAAASDKSMTRFEWNGPRSLMVTTTVSPVLGLVT